MGRKKSVVGVMKDVTSAILFCKAPIPFYKVRGVQVENNENMSGIPLGPSDRSTRLIMWPLSSFSVFPSRRFIYTFYFRGADSSSYPGLHSSCLGCMLSSVVNSSTMTTKNYHLSDLKVGERAELQSGGNPVVKPQSRGCSAVAVGVL